jgi:cytosine/creatinine deaminase
MFDLLIRHANLPDGQTDVALAIKNGRISAVAPDQALASVPSLETLDAEHQLLSPPFVDAHFHLDSALRFGQPRVNQSGTLREGIALWGALKPTLTRADIEQTATQYCHWALANGILAIRSHVDISDPELVAVQALLNVRSAFKPWLDLQLVAFPQDGLLRRAGAQDNLIRALDMGVDVIGGIPHFERTAQDGTLSIEWLCRLAAERGLMVDMHCDETDDPMSRHIETLTTNTVRFGLQGRVTGSHLTSMHSMDNDYAAKLIQLMAEANMRVVANPLINITLQGRHDTYPKRRGMTRVRELTEAGLTVAFGQDCVMDPWYNFGSGDMLEVAHMGLHVGQLTSQAQTTQCFEAVTTQAACVLGLEASVLVPGARADLVLLQAKDASEAIRLRATRLAVIRAGRCIARTPPKVAELSLGSQTVSVNWRL